MTFDHSSHYTATFETTYTCKICTSNGYPPFCSTDYAGFSQLHKWLTTYVSHNVAEQSGVSQRSIERLLSIYIEILKEIP